MWEDLERVLINLRFTEQVLGDARRMLICEPHRVADVQAAVDECDRPGLYTVRGSEACPAGRIIALDEPAMEASTNQNVQRYGRGIGACGS